MIIDGAEITSIRPTKHERILPGLELENVAQDEGQRGDRARDGHTDGGDGADIHFLGRGGRRVLSALAVFSAATASLLLDSASAAAARLAACSSIMRMNFLYGDQNAWRRLMRIVHEAR